MGAHVTSCLFLIRNIDFVKSIGVGQEPSPTIREETFTLATKVEFDFDFWLII